jgi:hypothetical protein
LRETRIKSLLSVAIALSIGLGASACGGEDGDDDGNATTEAPSAVGDDLTIDPESGPSGTVIAWTISNCDPGSEKSASIYTGSPGGQEGTKAILEGPQTKEETGEITVPAGTAPGEYTVIGTCLTRKDLGGGQIQLGVRDAGELAFTVTE